MKSLFICGTDTGVGKTVVTGCLGRYLKERGYSIITQKWIETGSNAIHFSSDIKKHLKIIGLKGDDIKDYLDCICPYIFRLGCSPHLASRIEKRRIKSSKIIKSFNLLATKFDFVIIEGIGGLLVPFNQRELVIDIVKSLNLAVLVVVDNRLGAINHTLLTIEALRQRKIHILGIIFNNLKKENKFILEDNPRIIKVLSKSKIFGRLSRQSSYEKIYQEFIPIGDKIWRLIR